jgi:ArsR family transcriptional regulator, arsenate/arsenite/antimonite-responsive transcriptional repressor
MSNPSRPIPLCPAIVAGKLSPAQAETVAAVFRALADPARVRLLSLIAAQPSAEACACHFTERLGLSQPTVSHHLKVLREAGLLERERRGSWLYYRVASERLAAVADVLAPGAARRARHG